MFASALKGRTYRRTVSRRCISIRFLHTVCCSIFSSGGFIMLKRIFVALLTMLSIVGATATLTACNTMEGAGKDIQRAGGAIEDKANENR